MEAILKTLFIAMIPFGELRVAIPLGIAHYNLEPLLTFFISIVGNLIPVVIIAFLLEPVSKWLSKHSKFFRWFFNWLFERTRKNSPRHCSSKGRC